MQAIELGKGQIMLHLGDLVVVGGGKKEGEGWSCVLGDWRKER